MSDPPLTCARCDDLQATLDGLRLISIGACSTLSRAKDLGCPGAGAALDALRYAIANSYRIESPEEVGP